jgi:maltooligosyltrehalose trehalohydrolase
MRAIEEGFVYQGEYSRYRKRRHGNSTKDVSAERFVHFCQNHAQVGNRMTGERLAALAPFEALKLAAGVLLASPCVPLLFMGEEYGEDRPFLYFSNHLDPDLAKAVREGRQEEFRAFAWEGEVPDPGSPDTFAASRIDWERRYRGNGKMLVAWFRRLLALRKSIGCLANQDRDRMEVCGSEEHRLVAALRWSMETCAFWVANFEEARKIFRLSLPKGHWRKILDSNDSLWGGPGPVLPDRLEGGGSDMLVGPYGFALFVKDLGEGDDQRAGA